MNLDNYTEQELKNALKEKKAVKAEERKTLKELIQKHIPYIIGRLQGVSEILQKEKIFVYEALRDILKLKLDIYETRGNNQSHTFTTETGESIIIGYRVNDAFDDTVNEGISKVNEFVSTLAKDEDSAKLVKAINRLLKKDVKGNLKANRVIELQNLAEDFNDERFTDGVDIIAKSYKPVRSAFFIEACYTENGKKITIPLSITSVYFPQNFDLSFLIPVNNE